MLAAAHHRAQRLAAEARIADWCARGDVGPVIAAIEGLDAAPPNRLDTLVDAARPLLLDHGWLHAFVDAGLAAMLADPVAATAIPAFASGAIEGLTLIERPGATLMLGLARASLTGPAHPDRLVFDDGFSMTQIIAGGPMMVARYRREGEGIVAMGVEAFGPGTAIALDHGREQIALVEAVRDTLFVRIACKRDRAAPLVEEFDCASGRPTRRACADLATSRFVALLDLAATSARAERVEVFEQLAQHPLASLRWQAMRHWLAADTINALPTLRGMAAQDADPAVRAVAAQTLGIIAAAATERRAA